MGRAEVMPPALRTYMSADEYAALFQAISKRGDEEFSCSALNCLIWIFLIVAWPAGGFIMLFTGSAYDRYAQLAIVGKLVGPAAEKAGLSYVFIPGVSGDGYDRPSQAACVRFFLPSVPSVPAGVVAVDDAHVVGIPLQPMSAVAVAPAAPIAQQMQVTVPAGIGPGMPFAVITPSGQQMTATCPPGASAGGVVMLSVPGPAMPTAVATYS